MLPVIRRQSIKLSAMLVVDGIGPVVRQHSIMHVQFLDLQKFGFDLHQLAVDILPLHFVKFDLVDDCNFEHFPTRKDNRWQFFSQEFSNKSVENARELPLLLGSHMADEDDTVALSHAILCEIW
jgi:hypothetical protein